MHRCAARSSHEDASLSAHYNLGASQSTLERNPVSDRATRMSSVRGEHRVMLPMPWRLDGDPSDPTAPLVVGLHGMGMDEDFFAILLQKLFVLPFRFLLPRGPYPVEVGSEHRIGASWYAYDGDQDRFRIELERTERIILELLRSVESAHGLRPRTRVLYGFSQGGYCGSYLALRNPDLFGGMVIAGARVKTELLEMEMKEAAARGFRVLLCHGKRDSSVSPEAAARSRDALAKAGVDVTFETFEAGHSVNRAQIDVVARWLERHFA